MTEQLPEADGPLDGVIVMTAGQQAEWSSHRSGMAIQFGVSGDLSGSEEVFMTRQKIPPGMYSTPHWHVNCETAMYILQGPIVMAYGEKLEHVHEVETGDFLYVPPRSIHQISNPREDRDAEVVLCRNAAEEIVAEVDIPGAPGCSPAE
ncbi:MAG: cupin domain-containing protein [Chloroflexi bacterium]|nr:cupin domain-containing protein [Chloroflexota bacterium]